MVTSRQLREAEAWDLLRQKHVEKALALLRAENDENPGMRASLGYGAALMWTGLYENAAVHFEKTIEDSRRTKNPMARSENHYSLGGAARWFLGDHRAAVKLWRLGVKAPYAVYGVCLESPLLLVLASILEPGLCDRAEATEMLRKKSSDPRVSAYPGTLAQFVAGTIDLAGLEASAERRAARYAQCLQRDRKWKIAFYRAVLDSGRCAVTSKDLQTLMKEMTEPGQFDDLDSLEFWNLTRCAEFYVARWEASRELKNG